MKGCRCGSGIGSGYGCWSGSGEVLRGATAISFFKALLKAGESVSVGGWEETGRGTEEEECKSRIKGDVEEARLNRMKWEGD